MMLNLGLLLLTNYVKQSKGHSPKTVEEHEYMTSVPYAFVVRNWMYAMVCARLDITHVVRVHTKLHGKSREITLRSCDVALEISERYIEYFTLL